jgi:Tfp pilus assembly major pilin PilA
MGGLALSCRGGNQVRSGRGFTLLGILVVGMIVGILTAIAIPKSGATRKEADVTATKSDLRNLPIARVAAGWKATPNHSQVPGKPCYIIGGGNTTANSPAVTEGDVTCTP